MVKRLFLLLVLFSFASFGCAPKKAKVCVSPEDNPPHHYLYGMKDLEKGNISGAIEKFNRAIYCDSKFSPAYSAKALAVAIRGTSKKEINYRETDFKEALSLLNKAKKRVKNDSEKFIYDICAMRVYTEIDGEDWLKKVEKHFKDALELENVTSLPYYGGKDAAYYFMGKAYMKAYDFKDAEDMFSKVLSFKASGKWQTLADAAYKKAQKIVRAKAGYTLTDVAKEIATKDNVTRADVCALLVDELKIDRLFLGRIPKKMEISKNEPEFIPADIMNHPFKQEILDVLKWHIRGLECSYDKTTKAYLFRPNSPITRKELALTLEDLLIKLTGDTTISSAYLGVERSPFPDVKPHCAWFNAVMNVTTRGLMEPDLSGEFRPNDYADGADLLLALFKLRSVLNY